MGDRSGEGGESRERKRVEKREIREGVEKKIFVFKSHVPVLLQPFYLYSSIAVLSL